MLKLKLSAYRHPAALISALALAGCASVQRPVQQQAAAPPPELAVLPTLPPAFQPGEIVGRWGFAAYHKEGDRGRTEAAAKAQCNNPYVIRPGRTGGVMMHLADDAKASGPLIALNIIGVASQTTSPTSVSTRLASPTSAAD